MHGPASQPRPPRGAAAPGLTACWAGHGMQATGLAAVLSVLQGGARLAMPVSGWMQPLRPLPLALALTLTLHAGPPTLPPSSLLQFYRCIPAVPVHASQAVEAVEVDCQAVGCSVAALAAATHSWCRWQTQGATCPLQKPRPPTQGLTLWPLASRAPAHLRQTQHSRQPRDVHVDQDSADMRALSSWRKTVAMLQARPESSTRSPLPFPTPSGWGIA